MNDASYSQMKAVGESCPGYSPVHAQAGSITNALTAGNRSCTLCRNWDRNRCVINLFDKVLTSLDQT